MAIENVYGIYLIDADCYSIRVGRTVRLLLSGRNNDRCAGRCLNGSGRTVAAIVGSAVTVTAVHIQYQEAGSTYTDGAG